jgi:hypothetical protein
MLRFLTWEFDMKALVTLPRYGAQPMEMEDVAPTTFPCYASGMKPVSRLDCLSITEAPARNARYCMPENCECPWRVCIACATYGKSAAPKVVDYQKGLCQPHLDAGMQIVSKHDYVKPGLKLKTSPIVGSEAPAELPTLSNQARRNILVCFNDLNARERMILDLLLADPDSQFAANELRINAKSVDTSIYRIYEKTCLRNYVQKAEHYRLILINLYREYIES